jgi:hypothetical protein
MQKLEDPKMLSRYTNLREKEKREEEMMNKYFTESTDISTKQKVTTATNVQVSYLLV